MYCPLVLACDQAYAMPLATALRSIVEANRPSWPLEFHVLTDVFSHASRAKVLHSLPKGSCTITWVEVDLSPFEEFSTLAHISKITYARFLIPHIFPQSTAKVLYLDADIVVLNDLSPLLETDLQEAVVGAVVDGLDAQIKAGKQGLESVPRVKDYFNAGVMLLNLDKWREERISEKALAYLAQNPATPFSDQDALNVACDGHWKKLDARWNFVDYFERVEISRLHGDKRPSIVHFATWNKPWNARIPNRNSSLHDDFRSRTRFARTPLEQQRDLLWHSWAQLKFGLKKYPAIRAILHNGK
jgi:lipopolysaccharide biosynthesis glycosyltransferase